MSGELREVWVCKDAGCELRVRNPSIGAIPMPAGWSDDELCPQCRPQENDDKSAAARKRPRIGKRPGPKRRVIAAEVREQIKRELDATFDTDEVIASRLHVEHGVVRIVRREANIAPCYQRATRARRANVARIAEAHPDWGATAIEREIGVPAKTVTNDLKALGIKRARAAQSPTSRRPKLELVGDVRDRAEAMLREGIASNEICRSLDVPKRAVWRLRQELGLPPGAVIQKARSEERVRTAVEEHPEWTNEQIGEAIEEPPLRVAGLRRALDLPRRRQGETRQTAA